MANKASSMIDLNTIDENVLAKKLKIPARLARRIIALRPYQSVQQLDKVWGIDSQTLERIKPLLTVSTAEAPASEEGRAVASLLPAEENLQEPPVSEPTRLPDLSPLYEVPARPVEPLKTTAPVIAKPKTSSKANLLLLLILLVGAYFRFVGLNWDENHHQHPDERYVTMVTDAIRGVGGVSAYFDTVTSSLNPLNHGSYTYGMLPLFITRMAAEWGNWDNYDEITLVGRAMSGLFDLAAIWVLYLLGKRLYNTRTGLLAAALAAAAVLPIQLSHFFAVDSFSTVFVVSSVYFAILAVPIDRPQQSISRTNWAYFGVFGFIVGLAGACKVNTLPVFGVLLTGAAAHLISRWKKPGFGSILKTILIGSVLAVITAFIAFRVFQPYAFAGPGFFGLSLNQRWLDVIKEVTLHVAGQSDWPPNHHWTNRSFTYAWNNIVLFGLGLPLGLAGWLGWAWAAWRIWKGEWRRHLLPVLWVGAYFIWQNIQFWRYMRYFLPIYPFIILLAAWALWELYERSKASRARLWANGLKWAAQKPDLRTTWKGVAALLALVIVLVGTYAYAFAFTRIYTRPISRIAASRWILENIPGPLNLKVETGDGEKSYPVAVFNNRVVIPGELSIIDLRIPTDGTATSINTNDVRPVGVNIYFRLTSDEAGEDILTEGRLALSDEQQDEHQSIDFGALDLPQIPAVYLHYKIHNSSVFSLSEVNLCPENQEIACLPVDMNIQDQPPGSLEGMAAIRLDSFYRVNRLSIDRLLQVFTPSETVLKVSIIQDGDDQNPLAVAEQSIRFDQPGAQAAPSFPFEPVVLTGAKVYQVRYEILKGVPLRISSGTYALETSWDDALPLSVDKFDGLGGIYQPLNLELYETDTPEKRDAMIQVLEQSDYLVIPSNRAYDSMPRLPLRYPMTTKYYQALFDCANCTGDALENKAYGLQTPYHSPLGFDLAATFTSRPNLGPLTIADEAADESFTVYDHPKVFIFKKSADFSIDKVRELLYSVDLDQVIFQTPMSFTRAPNAMQLPPDRLAVQTIGGTWSSMFNRLALINQSDVFAGAAWYILLLLLGWIVFPLVFVAFSGLPDRGYAFIRMAALIILAWMAWIMGSLKIMPFTQVTIFLCLGLLILINAVLAVRQRQALLAFLRSHWKHLLATEVIFLIIFLFSLNIRLGNPDLWHPWLGGEKPMDFAFFNATLKSFYFPPENPWFSGHTVNYYYYGYVIAAIPTKLLGILPSIAYNLILPAWFAMTGIGVFSVTFNLIRGFSNTPPANKPLPSETRLLARIRTSAASIGSKGLPYFTAVFALLAVLFFGNLHMVRQLWHYLPEAATNQPDLTSPIGRIEGVISGAEQVISGDAQLPGDKGRWYFEASRPILHDGPDTPIAEFPYFTFLYADLHPHLLTMPFYAVAIGWMLGLLLLPLMRRKWIDQIISLVVAALVIGSFRASHTWDLPTFLGLAALVVAWNVWQERPASFRGTFYRLAGYVLALVGLAVVFYSPFARWFRTEYVSLELWKGLRTPLTDYFFVFGLSLFVMISLWIRHMNIDLRTGARRLAARNIRKSIGIYVLLLASIIGLVLLWINDYQVVAFGLPLLAGMVYLIFFKRSLNMLQRLIWILFAVGISLTLLVEVVVLKGDSGRSNMVFRMYIEAWFFLGIATAAALVEIFKSLSQWPGRMKWAWVPTLLILTLISASYPLIATGKKVADRWPEIQNPPHTLDGAAFMAGEAPDSPVLAPAYFDDEGRRLNLSLDYAAIQFMQDHIPGSPVIVEGNTSEYRWGGRFSIQTGLPSVAGWSWHVRQHNSLLDGALVENRINQINEFYNTQDIQVAEQFLKRYQVKYIVLADLERAYYAPEGLAKFQNMINEGMLDIVYGDNTSQTATIFEVKN